MKLVTNGFDDKVTADKYTPRYNTLVKQATEKPIQNDLSQGKKERKKQITIHPKRLDSQASIKYVLNPNLQNQILNYHRIPPQPQSPDRPFNHLL